MKILGYSGLHGNNDFIRDNFPELQNARHVIAQGNNSAATLLNGNGIIAAAAEERFSRIKVTGAFPRQAMNYCMKQAGIDLRRIDYIAHGFNYAPVKHDYDNDPLLKSQYDIVYSREAQEKQLEAFFGPEVRDTPFIQVPHHLAHAASSYYVSGFDRSLILVADGIGEKHNLTIAVGDGNHINIVNQVSEMHSLGILYGVVTRYLGFVFGQDEYKVMGLAPYGDPSIYLQSMRDLVQLQDKGLYTIPSLYENRTALDKVTYEGTLKKLEAIFGPRRQYEDDITKSHTDIAASLQQVLEETLLHVVSYYQALTKLDTLSLAGGVCLNCTANNRLKNSGLFKDVFVQPAAGDDGTALGAALYVQRQKQQHLTNTRMTVPLWGPEFSDSAVSDILDGYDNIHVTHYDDFDELTHKTADLLADGCVIAWVQGRMEFGPRALGNRSILGDPGNPEMKSRINRLVKKRESFRPFAPAVLDQYASEYFDIEPGDEYAYSSMLFITRVKDQYRDCLPAVTHVNGSARVQTVMADHNPKFWALINSFYEKTGTPMVLNTSFNVAGQPVVCNPTEAIETFLLANLDALVINNFLVRRKTASSDQ